MYDSGKVITGLIIFVVLFTSPVWYNLSNSKSLIKPNLVLPTKENQKECVESTEFMRSNHMELLNEWRYEVVRKGERTFTSEDGKHFNMSLTNTCLNCHSDKSQFCDQCHNYVGISAYCWDCHNEPKNQERRL
jgi:[DsrC]-trisulfide reductase subunit J